MNTILTLFMIIAIVHPHLCWAEPAERVVAVTIDDLPGPPRGLVANDVEALRKNTVKLLAAFQRYKVPAIGFVNEGKLFLANESAEQAQERIAILKLWTDRGFELGNHTYSHRSLNTTALETFQEDVIRGETVTRQLLVQHGMPLRYFRHPFLHVGLDLEKRQAFEVFLRSRGYIVAPVTSDNDDYIFAAVYANALRQGDRRTAKKVADDYVRYIAAVFEFDEVLSRRLLGREIPQILLLHANTLNADYFGRLARMLQSRGYRFITLEDALSDEAYRREDTYVGDYGLSWLHHWELTAGLERSPSPDPPKWIMQAYTPLGY